jgi:hypothetical protein
VCGAATVVVLVLRAATFHAWPSDARFAWSARLLASCAGTIKHSLILHPDDTHIIYPLGSTIVVKNVEDTDDQIFLQGARTALRRRSWRRRVWCLLGLLSPSPARTLPHDAATRARSPSMRLRGARGSAAAPAPACGGGGAHAVLRRPYVAVEAAAARLPRPPRPHVL